jgi:hypothetical protein
MSLLSTEQFWIIDYRIFDKAGDGKSKLDHVREMFDHTCEHKHLPFRTVLMDSWYATRPLMLHIERAGKLFYCPLKDNRLVNAGDADHIYYQRLDSLAWSDQEHRQGKSGHGL